jgi:GNAT superfamily N-acetyltransferase
MSIRKAAETDQVALQSLTRALLDEICVGRGGRELRVDLSELFDCESESLYARLAEAATSGWVIVADALVGFGMWFNGVGLIYVSPESRQQGFGRGLYRAIQTEHSIIDFWVRPGDRAAKSFGEALGLKARKLIMNDSQGADDEE